jgi:hypothetical protein
VLIGTALEGCARNIRGISARVNAGVPSPVGTRSIFDIAVCYIIVCGTVADARVVTIQIIENVFDDQRTAL